MNTVYVKINNKTIINVILLGVTYIYMYMYHLRNEHILNVAKQLLPILHQSSSLQHIIKPKDFQHSSRQDIISRTTLYFNIGRKYQYFRICGPKVQYVWFLIWRRFVFISQLQNVPCKRKKWRASLDIWYIAWIALDTETNIKDKLGQGLLTVLEFINSRSEIPIATMKINAERKNTYLLKLTWKVIYRWKRQPYFF